MGYVDCMDVEKGKSGSYEPTGMIILSIIVGVLLFIQARGKGYNPWLWFYAFSLIGYVVLSFLPYTTRILRRDSEEQRRLRKRGNLIGASLSLLNLTVDVTLLILGYQAGFISLAAQ